MTTALARIDATTATAMQMREWSIAVRDRIPDLNSDELAELEAMLIAVKHRLRQLGQDISEAERTRIRAVQRIGVLLGPAERGGDRRSEDINSTKNEMKSQSEMDRNHKARLLAAYPQIVDEALSKPKAPALTAVVNMCKRQRAADQAAEVIAEMAQQLDLETEEQPALSKWWQLGDHLLYCGDSADDEFIDRAKGARFAFADPPYNVGKADWDAGFKWRHDYLADAAEVVAVTPGNRAIADFYATTQMPYRWSMAAWISNGMTRGDLGFGNWIYIALFSDMASIYRGAQDHMSITVDATTSGETSHESRKPARLLVDLLELFTAVDDTVIDPFLGSGTTLFAAEQTGRRCIGAEINPAYYSEIIARYGADARPL